MPVHDRVRRVVERAEHAGDVAERAALDAALAQRPQRLAFEIDDDEVVAGVEDLAEVVVAVRADALAGDPAAEHRADVLLQIGFARQQLLHVGMIFRAAADELQRLHHLRADVLIDRALIVRRERLGRESRNVGARREREMHLGGAAAEKLGVGEIRGNHFLRQIGKRGPRRQLVQRLMRNRLRDAVGSIGVAQQAFVVAADRIDRERPGVAGARREALHDRERHRLVAVIRLEFDRAGERRDISERRLFVQEPRHFEVGVHTRLEPPEQLQEQSLPVHDRRVALLRFQHLGMQQTGPAKLAHRARRRADGGAADAFELAPPRDDVEQLLRERFVGHRLVQERAVAQASDQRRAARVVLFLGAPCLRDAKRQQV